MNRISGFRGIGGIKCSRLQGFPIDVFSMKQIARAHGTVRYDGLGTGGGTRTDLDRWSGDAATTRAQLEHNRSQLQRETIDAWQQVRGIKAHAEGSVSPDALYSAAADAALAFHLLDRTPPETSTLVDLSSS